VPHFLLSVVIHRQIEGIHLNILRFFLLQIGGIASEFVVVLGIGGSDPFNEVVLQVGAIAPDFLPSVVIQLRIEGIQLEFLRFVVSLLWVG
jgi:hypothetical protein